MTRPSWWNVRHLLMLIGAFIALFSSILVWVVVLRRRVAEQTEQIERSMRVERQRSRLLEEINSETPLEHLLDDICSSMDALVRCTRCTCTLLADTLGTREHSVSGKGVGLQSVYESALTDIKGRRIGTFRVDQTGPGTLSDDERSTLGVGAGLANLALNQRRLYTELNHRSTHDQLTALPNRRLCDTHLVAAVRDAAQQGTKVGVAYIDVDHFKEVNDQYGHRIGDLYLQQIAARLGSKVRAVDLLARIGGDEFLLVATALESVEDAETYRQRLQSCFENTFVLDEIRIQGSASIGLAIFPDHGKALDELMRHADGEMYVAKRSGRSEDVKERGLLPRTEVVSIADRKSALETDESRLFHSPQLSAQGSL